MKKRQIFEGFKTYMIGNKPYHTTLPTFERLKDWNPVREFGSNKYKVVKFAYDEGHNGYALLDMRKKKIISWSLTGESEFKKFRELNT